MLWLSGLLFLTLRWYTKKHIGGKASQWLWWLPFALLALGVCALAYAPLPFGWGSVASIAGWALSWVLALIGSWFGVSSQVVAGVLLFLVLLTGLTDLIKDRHPDGWAKTMVYAAPVLVLMSAGPLAPYVLDAIHSIGSAGPSVVHTIT